MTTVLGTDLIRSDGHDKVTGTGHYTADLTMAGMLHAKFRYADHTHARITRIDTTRARELPGVFAVITQADVPDVRYGAFVQDRTLFAKDVVRFEGEIVAAVAARTPEIAEQAAALIEVDYEPLPAVADIEASLADGHARWCTRTGRATARRTRSSATATTPPARPSPRATSRPAWRQPTSSCASGTRPTCRMPCRSSRTRSSPTGWARR